MTDWNKLHECNVPIPFTGSKKERLENYKSHDWWMHDPDEAMECGACAARSYHVAACYPCGTEPPRKTILMPAHPDYGKEEA